MSEKFLEKMAKSKLGYAALFVVYKIVCFVNYVRDYFVKDAEVVVYYVTWKDENGDYRRIPNSFNIYITSKRRCESLFGEVDFDEASRLIELLKQDDKPLSLEMGAGLGTTSLYIPSWAKHQIIEELEEVIEETAEDRAAFKAYMNDEN